MNFRAPVPARPGPVIFCLLLFCVPACVGGSDATAEPVSRRSEAIVIGAFNFSESRVLAEIYRQMLESHGQPAVVIDRVASREIMEPALEQGEVDLVIEYLGTALSFVDPTNADPASPEVTHARLRQAFATRGITVLDFSPGQNRNEVVITEATAARHGLSEISDLRTPAGELVLGGPPECPARPLCLAGLTSAYGLNFASFVPLDPGGPATVAALAGGEIDVAILFTTSPAFVTHDLMILEDDRHLQPSENIVPVVRDSVLQGTGASIPEVLAPVTARLTDLDLRELNFRAEIDHEDPEEIALDWLTEKGLL